MISLKALALIRNYESLHDGDLSVIGCQPKMDCLGIWTVGYGHAIIDPTTLRFLKGAANKARAYELYPSMSESEAEALLQRDLGRYEANFRSRVTVSINEEQRGALVSFMYNCGMGSFNGSTLLKLLNRGEREKAAEQLLLWDKGQDLNGRMVALPGLTARRKSERELFLTGSLKFYN